MAVSADTRWGLHRALVPKMDMRFFEKENAEVPAVPRGRSFNC